MAIFLSVSCYLVVVAAKYTIGDHEFYQQLADRQQIRTESSFVNRGTVYATWSHQWGESTILAASAIVKDFKVDPSQEGDRSRLADFVTEVVYRHLCEERSQLDCYDNIQAYTDNYELAADFRFDEQSIKVLLMPTIREQVNRRYKTRIFLEGDLNQDMLAELKNLDNNGIVVEGDTAYMDPTVFWKSSRDIVTLSRVLKLSPDELNDALIPRVNRNVDIVEKLSLWLAEYITETISLEREQVRSGLLEIEQAIYPFLKLEDHPVRIYPEGHIASHITWFVDGENVGRYGVEGFFEQQLSGVSSDVKRHKDALGRPIDPLGEEENEEVRGIDVYLTIDRNIQKEVMQIMKRFVTDFWANSWSAIVMDPSTWAIRAMVSFPSYDPERPGNVYNIERFKPV